MGRVLLRGCLESIAMQSVKPSQVVVSAEPEFLTEAKDAAMDFGSIPNLSVVENGRRRGIGGNSNSGLDQITSQYAWVLHQDDRLIAVETVEGVLREICRSEAPWFVLRSVQVNPLDAGTLGPNGNLPSWKGRPHLVTGRNPLGPPSTSVWLLSDQLRFDERLCLLVDLDFYLSLNQYWTAEPRIIDETVGVGEWAGQTQKALTRTDLFAELPTLWRRAFRRLGRGPIKVARGDWVFRPWR